MRRSAPFLLLCALSACGGHEDREPEPGEVERFTAKIEADEAKAKAASIRESRSKEQERGEAARARTASPKKSQ